MAGAIAAAITVMLGAFGAHGLETMLMKPLESSTDTAAIKDAAKRLDTWDTGSRYQMYHAFGLIVAGLLCVAANRKLCLISGWAFVVGMIFFSGSLYLLTLTSMTWLGAIAPIGGTAYIVGWIALALAARKLANSRQTK